jgi:ATP-dependent exoDNAse (exonuclease V) alpha subunit
MSSADTTILQRMVDCDTYALLNPNSDAWHASVQIVRSGLQDQGCSVLQGFIRPEVVEQLEQEGEAVAPQAYYATETVNVFNTDPTQ